EGLRRAREGLIRTVGPLRGRVLWRRDGSAGLRTATADLVIEPAGDAAPGDLVEVARPGEPPRVVRRYQAAAPFPEPSGEVARRPRHRLEALAARAKATAAIRSFFDQRGFLEVDAPVRVRAPGLEVH